MNEFEPYLIEVERTVSEKEGEFTFFALFLREDAPNRWDLVIAAPWIDRDPTKGIKVVAKAVSSILPKPMLERISKVVPVGTDNPGTHVFSDRRPIEQGWDEIKNEILFGLRIVQGYVVTARLSSCVLQAS